MDIAQNLRARLADDSQRLGNVAEGLLSVQSDVNRVEKESLGKARWLQCLCDLAAGTCFEVFSECGDINALFLGQHYELPKAP